jgi:hypothetical protein
MSIPKDPYYFLQLEKEKTKRLELKIKYRKHLIDAIMRLNIEDSDTGSQSGSDTSSEYPDLEYIKHQKKGKHTHKHSNYEDAVKEATSDSLSDYDDFEKNSDIHTDDELEKKEDEKDKLNDEEMDKYKEEQLENKIIELFSKIKK